MTSLTRLLHSTRYILADALGARWNLSRLHVIELLTTTVGHHYSCGKIRSNVSWNSLKGWIDNPVDLSVTKFMDG
jgi:hypothetical protein